MAVLIFAVKLHWVSAMSFGSPDSDLLSYLKAYALPVLTLCCVLVAQDGAYDAGSHYQPARQSFIWRWRC
ncbi:Uncharacterised protein [Pantoea agglomerans]|uniref:Uncharacterized protein n=1 Tax=Enterobacter agglomerans TaxID=549 RepID=A0A379AE13_ENTAG|nr:Uncharacterised protein [Pantoea agglomerans]